MNLTLTEEQHLLQDSANRYITQRYNIEARHAIAGSAEGYSAQVWQDFASFGWLALPLPEAHGGLGGDAVDVALLAEAFGRGLLLEPFVSSVIIGGGLIASAGTEAQRNRWLPAVAEGRALLALAHSEAGARHRLHQVSSTARQTTQGWLLSGSKRMVLDGPGADNFLVSANVYGERDDTRGLALFLVPTDTVGLTQHAFATIDDRRACHIGLNNVEVEAAARIGGAGDITPHIDACLDRARAAMTADALGCMQALLDATTAYAKTRVQFGQPLAANQVLRHRMVDMAVHCEEARSMVLLAALKATAEPVERALAISAAMNKVVRGARYVAEQAVQLHGAMGMTEEVSVGLWMKRLLAYEVMFGTHSYHLERHARLSGLLTTE